MKHISSIFISIVVATLLFTGCKKYEEGPSLTLRSVKSRLTNGDWELDKLTVDGIDSTDAYSEIKFDMSFTASSGPDAKSYTYDMTYTYEGQLVEIYNGSVFFRSEGDKIIFEPFYSYSSSYYYSPIFSAYDANSYNNIVWDITKLTNKEFWLETTINYQKVELKLKKNK